MLIRSIVSSLLFSLVFATPCAAKQAPDLIVIGSKIETSEQQEQPVVAFSVTDGIFTFVGSQQEALKQAGPKTRILRVKNKPVLPGLVDSHIHPISIIDGNICDLDSASKSLAEIAATVRLCVKRYQAKPGEWLSVAQWNYTNGNQPDPAHPTLRAALDLAAPDNPVHLIGNDGHHGAFNSAAFKLAQTPDGQVAGLSRSTLTGVFKDYQSLVDVDAQGEPSGGVNEDARGLIDQRDEDAAEFEAAMKAPNKVMQRLNAAGITAFLDASVSESDLAFYDLVRRTGQLTAYPSLAQIYNPTTTLTADGKVDYDLMVKNAVRVRDKYRDDPFIRADTVKLFADGVLEGNPMAIPPTLPNSASIKPFLQPIFDRDTDGRASFSGRYVDSGSAACIAQKNKDLSDKDLKDFISTNGFHPAQCTPSSGKLQHDRGIIMEYVARMHQAGLSLHIHAVGDGAARVALDALESARASGKNAAMRPDTLAHLQLVAPDDITRIGRNKIFLAMSFAWMNTEKDYDLSVIPFIQKVKGDSATELHERDSYYEQQAYPVKALQDAGAVVTGGSDAPVETRDPRPFFNMQTAVLRSRNGALPLNILQSIPVRDAVYAYTINGARALGRDEQFGSIKVGKSADFIIIDRDIFSIPPDQIGATKVEQTWFRGKQVFVRP